MITSLYDASGAAVRDTDTRECIAVPQPIDELCHSTAKDNLENMAVVSPQRLFIEQQLKWLTNPSVTARIWHPMIVRWAF